MQVQSGVRTATRAVVATALVTLSLVAVAPTAAHAATAPMVAHAATLPVAPTGVQARAASNQVTVRWVAPPAPAPDSPLTGFRVQKTRDGSTWAGAGLVAPTATSVTITRLANGVRLRFRVAAVTAAGTGPWSAPSAWVTPQETPPGRVSALAGISATRGRITLTWRPPVTGPAPTRYDYRYRKGFGTFTAWKPLPPSARAVSFGGLVPGADYLCQVRAVHRVDVSPTATLWVRVRG